MYVFYAYIRVCMHLCVYACMYISVHTCMYVIFKLDFEQNGRGNFPSWEGELSGGIVRGGNVRSPTIREGTNPQ